MVDALSAGLIIRFGGTARKQEGDYPTNGGIEAEAKGREKDCRP